MPKPGIGLAMPHAPTLPAPRLARATPTAGATERLANPLERSADLRAFYMRYKDSTLAEERHIARRAWNACFPTFIGPEGQAATLESVTAGVPRHDPSAAGRVEAYRELMGRCKGFADIGRAALLDETARQQTAADKGLALAPGELAAKYLREGDRARALRTAHSALASRDPATIASLGEFVDQFLVQQVDAQRAAQDERPDLRALAFAMAACRLGLECGAGSLTALQQCASGGNCSGGVMERHLQSVPEADRDRLVAETEKVVRAVAGGASLELGW
jgi:hypothetical protein